MFLRSIVTFWLVVAGLMAPPLGSTNHSASRVATTRLRAQASGAVRNAQREPLTVSRQEVAKASAERSRRMRRRQAAAVERRRRQAAAVERRLLLVGPQRRLLAHFVDRSDGFFKRNVSAHCELMHLRRGRRHAVYLCRVWQPPNLPSSGVKVLCQEKHKRFVVMAYPRRPAR